MVLKGYEKRRALLMFLVTGLGLLYIGCSDDKPLAPLPSVLELPSIPDLRIAIKTPEEGVALPTVENVVHGTVSGLPSGYALRVLVRPPGEIWWSQPAATILPDSSWTATVYVGIPADTGKNLTFLIGVVAVQAADDPPSGAQVRILGQMPAVITVTRR